MAISYLDTPFHTHTIARADALEACRKALALPDVPEWISVEDRLPDEQQNCWCIFRSRVKIHCRYLQGSFCWYNFEDDRYIEIESALGYNGITHWQPLPAAPTLKDKP